MATETMTFLTDSGMTTITIPVTHEFDTGELRRAWSEGAGAGATAMWDALNPEEAPHLAGEFGDASRTVTLDAVVEAAAEAILDRTRVDDTPGVDWSGDLEDAKRIARAVLDALGWRDTPPPTAF